MPTCFLFLFIMWAGLYKVVNMVGFLNYHSRQGLLGSISLFFIFSLISCEKYDLGVLEDNSRSLIDSTKYDTVDVTITPAQWNDPVVWDSITFGPTTNANTEYGNEEGFNFETEVIDTIYVGL